VRKRFDDELIELLLAFKWWDRSIDEIQELIPLLSDGDLERGIGGQSRKILIFIGE
jgi:virginiamycin A acetyltransferase